MNKFLIILLTLVISVNVMGQEKNSIILHTSNETLVNNRSDGSYTYIIYGTYHAYKSDIKTPTYAPLEINFRDSYEVMEFIELIISAKNNRGVIYTYSFDGNTYFVQKVGYNSVSLILENMNASLDNSDSGYVQYDIHIDRAKSRIPQNR